MKLLKIFPLVFMVILFIHSGYTILELKPTAKYFQASDSVVMAKHAYGSNITCIAVKEGLYFVDCGLDTRILKKFRLDMEKKFKKKTLGLLITHAHIDHFFGMAPFKDVPVYAAEKGQSMWKKQLLINYQDERVIKSLTGIFPNFSESVKYGAPFMPTQWIKEKTVFGDEDNQIIFVTTGGHSSDSSHVWFTKEGVLVAGDLVQVDQYPYFGDPTTDLKAWLDTFEKWEALPIKKICPGHGKLTNLSYVGKMKNFFENLLDTLKDLKKQSVPVKEVINHPELPKGYWGEEIKQPGWWFYCIASLYNKI